MVNILVTFVTSEWSRPHWILPQTLQGASQSIDPIFIGGTTYGQSTEPICVEDVIWTLQRALMQSCLKLYWAQGLSHLSPEKKVIRLCSA